MTGAESRARECAPQIRRALLRWYGRHKRDLPWRRTRDPYAVWLAEILLQQTRVDQGLPYYERFVAAFPTVQSLAEASETRVLKLWEGLGYYSRARNLHKAAKRIVRDYAGEFPNHAAALQSLPGVGRYTAGAIASIAFDERTPVVDGNVIRVLTRLFDIDIPVERSEAQNLLWRIAGDLVPAKQPGDFNQGVMELGAKVCLPRNPQCDQCPLRALCLANIRRTQLTRPVRREKKATPHHTLVAAVTRKRGRYLIAQRPAEGMLGGLWEFPNMRVARGESANKTLGRLLDALRIETEPGTLIAAVDHAYSHFRITLHAYACEWTGGTPESEMYTAYKWVRPAEFSRYAFPKAAHKIIAAL